MKESAYAILGLGRYGRKIAATVAATGAEILIADSNPDIVDRYADKYTHAVSLDLSDARALQEIGLENIDVAVVDINHNLEAAIMSITVAKELGVKKVIATAKTLRTADVLKRVGADEVVIPEDEAAIRMAKRLISEDFMEFFDLGGDLCIVKVSPKKEWINKTLKKLNLPEKLHINVVAIEDENGQMTTNISADTAIKDGQKLALAMKKADIYEFV